MFAHPLLRATAYAQAGPVEQRRAHAILAEALGDDVEQRAWHLAEAALGPSEDVAAALEQAAARAAERGGKAGAARAFTRAAALAPPGRARWDRLLVASHASYLAGRWDDAVTQLGEVLSAPLDRELRSRALVLQAQQATWGADFAQAAVTLRAGFEELVDLGDPNAIAVGLQLAGVLVNSGHLAEMRAATSRLLEVVLPDHPLLEAVKVYDAIACLFTGALWPHDLGIERVALLSAQVAPEDLAFWAPTMALFFYWTERVDGSVALLERQLETIRSLSAASLLPFPLLLLSDAHLRRGDLVRAKAEVDQAISLCVDGQLVGLVGMVEAFRAVIAGVEGDDARCAAHTSAADAVAMRTQQIPVSMFANTGRGVLALSRGHPEAALKPFRANVELAHRAGLVLPTVARWQGDYVHALVATGQLGEARAALEELEDANARTGTRWGRGVALRGRALLEPASAEEQLREAMALQADEPYELGRSLLVLGEHLRRSGRMTEARDRLAEAVDVLQNSGARPWADRADAALRATGVHRARRSMAGESLTERELQVALAVADGATNRQAASALFMSEKTVEYHLAKVFRKLGVHNRTQLARAITHARAG